MGSLHRLVYVIGAAGTWGGYDRSRALDRSSLERGHGHKRFMGACGTDERASMPLVWRRDSAGNYGEQGNGFALNAAPGPGGRPSL